MSSDSYDSEEEIDIVEKKVVSKSLFKQGRAKDSNYLTVIQELDDSLQSN